MKETDNIQDLFSKAFENHTSPVRPEVWQGLQAKMAASGIAGTAAVKGLSSLTKWLIGAGITGSVGVATTLLVMNSTTEIDKPSTTTTAARVELSQDVRTPEAEAVEPTISAKANNNTSETNSHNDMVSSLPEVVDNADKVVLETPIADPVIVSTTSVGTKPNEDNSVVAETQGKVNDIAKNESVTATTSTTVQNESSAESTSFISKNPPNIFTPNGDNDNDYYFFESKNISEFAVFILNSQNSKVFETTDANFKWDGTYRGEPCEVGKYICIVTGKDSNGKWFKKMWAFDLKR